MLVQTHRVDFYRKTATILSSTPSEVSVDMDKRRVNRSEAAIDTASGREQDPSAEELRATITQTVEPNKLRLGHLYSTRITPVPNH